MATNPVWSNPQMWRLAGAMNALRREIDKAKALVEGSVLTRLAGDYRKLEERQKRLVIEAGRIADVTDAERDALTQQIIQFYRDVGELERFAGSKRRGV